MTVALLDAQKSAQDTAASEPVEPRKTGPFGGMTASEAAAHRHALERSRLAANTASAELDRLTVGQRVSVALAREIGYANVAATIRALASKAESGHVQHARELREWLKLAGLDAGDAPADSADPDRWTPEQRAVARARLLGEIEAAEAADAEA